MTLKEAIFILNKYRLAFPNFELTENTIKLWHELFEQEPPKVLDDALRAAVKEPGRQFFPTPGDVQAYILKAMPLILTMKASEALSAPHPLAEEARQFAERVNVRDPKTQYSSPEELAKANEIHKACCRRDFKERFETLQARVKANVIKGISLERAVALEITYRETPALPLPVENLVKTLSETV